MAAIFHFDEKKAVNAVLWISSRVPKANFHKVFKILYFADQRHLALYGRPIVGDNYVAMANGPVPSMIYDYFKVVKGIIKWESKSYLNELFAVNGYFITPKKEADLEELSETDLECIETSIAENKDLSFSELTSKSHDGAYLAAGKSFTSEISFLDMAKTGGADEAMLKYIEMKAEGRLLK